MNDTVTKLQAEATAAAAQMTRAVADIRSLIANRVGDVLIAVIVVVAMLIGHRL